MTGTQTASSINIVNSTLSGLASETKLTASGILHALDKAVAAQKRFGHSLNKIAKDGTKGSKELTNQLIAMGPAGAEMANEIAGATPKVRRAIEHDIAHGMDLAEGQANSLETTLTGGFDRIAASMLVMADNTLSFKDALDQINGTKVETTTVNTTVNRVIRGHRAEGGLVGAGMPYIVGERGQELFVPDQGGTIIPNHNLSRVTERGGGGGGGPVVTRLRIDDWSTGMATIEVMARDAARDESGQDGARLRARRLA